MEATRLGNAQVFLIVEPLNYRSANERSFRAALALSLARERTVGRGIEAEGNHGKKGMRHDGARNQKSAC
jgi:hypothetical protein